MATLAALQAEVKRLVQDTSYDSMVIQTMLNQSVTDICGGVAVTWPEGDQTFLSPMPGLYTVGMVATSTSNPYVSLPSDYQRNVGFIGHPDGYEVNIYETFGDFRRNFPLLDMSGSVVGASVKGSLLYYQGIPSTSISLRVHYHAAPTDMSADADEPEGIPSRFHMTLLVYDVCLKIFREMYEEDSTKHRVVDAYEQKRNLALVDLESSIATDHGSVVFK